MNKDTNTKKYDQDGNELAIRFGLAGIKAVGMQVTEGITKERQGNGEFKDIHDFASRLDSRIVNKKSIEALAKAGGFDKIHTNRQQIFESWEIISKYADLKNEERASDQMSLLASSGIVESKPTLKKVEDWKKDEKLQKEFEAFGFFVNEHPIDDFLDDLSKRGVAASELLDDDEKISDNTILKLAGVVAYSKHRSGPRGRYAYLYLSDQFSIFETSIFDEQLITESRDLMEAGQSLVIECLVRKGEGGTRLLVKNLHNLTDFIKNNSARKEAFLDIKKQAARRDWKKNNENYNSNQDVLAEENSYKKKIEALKSKKVIAEITLEVKNRESILKIKSFLSQKILPENIKSEFSSYSKVSLVINGQNKKTIIELETSYLLDENDLKSLMAI